MLTSTQLMNEWGVMWYLKLFKYAIFHKKILYNFFYQSILIILIMNQNDSNTFHQLWYT